MSEMMMLQDDLSIQMTPAMKPMMMTGASSTSHSRPRSRLAGSSAMLTGVAMPRAFSTGSMSKGAFQPPRNRTAVIAERMNMFTYSAKKKKPKRMPLYSVAKPATISLSASVRSNGRAAGLGGGGDEEDERAERLPEQEPVEEAALLVTHDLVEVQGAREHHDAHRRSG